MGEIVVGVWDIVTGIMDFMITMFLIVNAIAFIVVMFYLLFWMVDIVKTNIRL